MDQSILKELFINPVLAFHSARIKLEAYYSKSDSPNLDRDESDCLLSRVRADGNGYHSIVPVEFVRRSLQNKPLEELETHELNNSRYQYGAE